MNLLKKNKYSIRKYKVGIFSTLIGTVLLLSNPNGAQALTTDNNVQSDTNQATPVNSQDKDVANNRGLANSAQNTPNQSATTNQATNQALVNHNNGSIVNQATPTSVQSSTPSAQNNNHTDGNTTATETVSNANNNDVVSNNTALNVPTKTNENGSGGHLTLKEIQEDVRHSSNKPELVAIAEPASNRPKKRSRRAAPADPNATPADPAAAAVGNGGAPVAITAPYTPTTDPNANNAGQNAPNEVLSFDDNGIRPSTNRSVPTVNVVNNLPGFTLINGGKVGVFSHAMVRTSMFDSGDNKNYQAQGNVIALGRIHGTDTNDHGDFNGIEKALTVNPNSELIFEFNTMTTKNGQGATNVIIKNADTNDTIAEKTVEGGPTLRLFKVPDNVRNLKIQFVPKNDAITDARGIYQLKDGYKYYSFVDSIGLHSGSHVFVERRTMDPTATNNKEFTVTTSLKNNGNSGASLDTNDFVYQVQLPEGVEYVNNSLTKDFPSNNSGVDVNDMNVTYDAANRVITIKSTGGGTANSPARLMPDKILDLRYKLRVNNVPTPRTVTFNETLTYKTYTQDFINSAAESHTVSTNPYTIDIIMNKDALQAEVDRRIQQADYTFASLDIFNGLKRRAQTILDENRNNVPLNKRVSQAYIDSLTNQMQHTLIRSVDAENAVNKKVDQMEDLVNQNDELTDEEKQAAIQVIEEHKNEIIGNIGDQTTDDGVTRIKDQGIQTLSGDTATPVVKPNAKKAIRDKATKQREIINATPDVTEDEIQDALNQLATDETDAIDNVTNATTNADVETAKNNGINTIGAVVPQVTHKKAARDAINQATATKRQQINSNREATQEEKNAALNELTQATNHALEQINQATTNADVDNAKGDGLNAINPIAPVTVVKQAARDAVSHDAQQHIAEINANPDATQEERQVALDKINEFVNQAMTDITNNRTNQQVDDTTSQALDSIALVTPDHIVRAAARDAVKQQYEAKKREIEQAEHATDEEKQVALNQLANNEKRALQNIDQAIANNDVKRVETNGIATLKGVQPHIVIKPEAQQAIKASAENQVESIKDTPHATVDELDEANQLISDTLKQAQQEIENTNQDAAVTDVRNQTIKAIEQIKPKVRRKRAALDSIEENNKNQLDAIRNTLDTTQDERDVAIDTLNKIVNTIKNDIAQNKTNAEVDRTETDGNDNIKVILPKVQVKPAARQSVGVKAEAQNALIDQSDLSTEEERLAAKHLVEQALNQAIDQINHADKTAQVNQDSINAQNIISKIKPATTVKATALQQIQNIATNKINLIKANNEATDEEQNIAIAQVEKELIKAKQQIASAVTNADVAYLLHDEKNEIREIEPVINRKASAREQLTTLFNDKKQAIEANIQATVEERNSILAQLQNIYDTAIGQIDQDRSNAQVDKTASLNLQTIHDLDVHPIKKPDAEKTINDDLARVTALVQNYRKVSNRNKADALKAITALKLQMDEELKTARTNADVDAVLKRFNVALSDIEAVITEKENSLLRIDNIAQQTYAKFKAIATPEQLAKVKVLIDQYVADGNRMIDEDATLNDIKQHTQFIVDEILAIKLPAEATKVSPKEIQPAPKVCTPIKKEETHESRKVEKELPNTGSEGMDLPLKEFALITGAALLARRRTKNEKES
ncbi:SasC/FmtB family protein [Staphylococcus aureus]|uniref:SasC/FmtB family protein n=1 Tax=Staphylococcus aureus TaxID=1280 RepID=UPI00390BB5E5